MKRRRSGVTCALLAILASSTACSEDPAFLAGQAKVIIGFRPTGGSYTARVNGQTFTGVGGFQVKFDPVGELHDITGSFNGDGLTVYFAASTMAGVESGSLTTIAGPAPRVLACEITYVAAGTGPHEFRFQFRTTGTSALVCT